MQATSQRDSVKKEHEDIKVRVRVCCQLPSVEPCFFCDGDHSAYQRLAIGLQLSGHRGLVTLGEKSLTPTRVLIARPVHVPSSASSLHRCAANL